MAKLPQKRRGEILVNNSFIYCFFGPFELKSAWLVRKSISPYQTFSYLSLLFFLPNLGSLSDCRRCVVGVIFKSCVRDCPGDGRPRMHQLGSSGVAIAAREPTQTGSGAAFGRLCYLSSPYRPPKPIILDFPLFVYSPFNSIA